MVVLTSFMANLAESLHQAVPNVRLGWNDCPIHMNPSPSNPNPELRRTTYLKAVAFLLPAVSLWGFSAVFLFPKLQHIWRDAGFNNPTAHRFMGASNFFTSHAVFISSTIILVLILLEWHNSGWPRYRRGFIGLAVFFLNTAVLVLLTAMFTTALLAAPALLQMK